MFIVGGAAADYTLVCQMRFWLPKDRNTMLNVGLNDIPFWNYAMVIYFAFSCVKMLVYVHL